MTAVTVRNIPDGLYLRLRAEAGRHRRSLNQETNVHLDRPSGGSLRSAEDIETELMAEIDAFHEELARRGVWITEAEVDRSIDEGRK